MYRYPSPPIPSSPLGSLGFPVIITISLAPSLSRSSTAIPIGILSNTGLTQSASYVSPSKAYTLPEPDPTKISKASSSSMLAIATA